MPQPIDMRSDTVTRPTDGMRQAMANAQVGDDVMRTDKTVIALEERIADMFQKEAALFTPSGTMANLLAILAQTAPGDEIMTHSESHIYYYEGGGYASLAGCSIRFADEKNPVKPGLISEQSLNQALRSDDIHFPIPKLLTIENTHNRGGGVVWPTDQLHAVCNSARKSGLRVHTDGARIWNAACMLDTDVASLVSSSDTVMACLSKGLGCPVGSLLIGDQKTIEIARRKRKMVGGGMRQAGVLAAAGLYALDHHVDRLEIDHVNAKRLATEIADLKMFHFDPTSVETNLVYAKLAQHAIEESGDAFAWEKKLSAAGVLCFAESASTIRFVTHLDLDESMVSEAIARIRTM